VIRRRSATVRRRASPPSPAEVGDDDWAGLAAAWSVPLLDRVDLPPAPETSPPPAAETLARGESLLLGEGESAVLVAAPRGEKRFATAALLARHPDLARRIAIAPPREIRRALIEAHAAILVRRACRALVEERPDFSALGTPGLPHLLFLAGALGLWAIASFDLFTPVVVVWTLFFLGIGIFRSWIAEDPPTPRHHPELADAELPRVAVLVPVYREAAVLPALVGALVRLDYPADRLALRLVVEGDDFETRIAAERATSDTAVEIVVVPPCLPRTKPKALNFALATVDAEIVTVFDAEDRPEPGQLRRAAAAFAAGDETLAVVQAALEIDHAESHRPWLVRQFEIEYAMLFHGLLPWLSQHRLLLPLGGTSNHFRRAALERIGAWDPHNVTEDVDIALRIARAGLSLEMIPSWTSEEAPMCWRAWRSQRVRWLKGWLQTWFVHTRDIGRLHRELGRRNALVFHLVLTGQIVSAFVFAPSLVLLALESIGVLSPFSDRPLDEDFVFVAALTAFAIGLLGSLALAAKVAGRRRRLRAFDVLTMPVYWCAVTVAACQAVVELIVAPSRWNKTSHGHVSRASDRPLAARQDAASGGDAPSDGDVVPVDDADAPSFPLASRPPTRL